MNFCSQCGAALEPDSRFCASCGTAVPAAEPALAQAPAAPGAAPAPADSQAPVETAPAAAPVGAAAAAPHATDGSSAQPFAPAWTGSEAAAPAAFETAPDNGDRRSRAGRPASRRLSRRVVVISVTLAVLVVAAVGAVVVLSAMRGGAASPEQAASDAITAANAKNLTGVFEMLPPNERDDAQRLEQAIVAKYQSTNLKQAVSRATGKRPGTPDFSLNGVTVHITASDPQVTSLASNVAEVSYPDGRIQVSLDPGKTTGVIRSLLDAGQVTYRSTTEISDYYENQPRSLTLIAVKDSGRWYISPYLTVLELFSASNSSWQRGQIPAALGRGASDPASAASDAVSAASGLNGQGGIASLARYLDQTDAEALYLYGQGLAGLALPYGHATFTAGPTSGDRSVATVEHAAISMPDAFDLSLTSNCATIGNEAPYCLKDGYGFITQGSSLMALMAGFSMDNKFSLDTVDQNGSWKVDLLQTATDHAVAWVNSLTRPQLLSLFGLASGDQPTTAMTIGKRYTVAINSGGYATATITVPRRMRLRLEGGLQAAELIDSAGRPTTYLDDEYAPYVSAGRYTLVLTPLPEWSGEFLQQGDRLAYTRSAEITEIR